NDRACDLGEDLVVLSQGDREVHRASPDVARNELLQAREASVVGVDWVLHPRGEIDLECVARRAGSGIASDHDPNTFVSLVARAEEPLYGCLAVLDQGWIERLWDTDVHPRARRQDGP